MRTIGVKHQHTSKLSLESCENYAFTIQTVPWFISHELSPIRHYANDCI